ncbi:MAG: acyl-CoA thioesterase/BAAT N-terminal domain-containing protein [Candidatus Dormibacteraeota bacterium]|nr:acyl-CoA thioesterase/BAAT N-terminal domain-containing protein [Candidatus Dormibacteraeota bacterium]
MTVRGSWRPGRRVVTLACLVLAPAMLTGFLLSACGGGPAHVSLRVSPRSSLMDSPLDIRVSGLERGERAQVRVASTDARGVSWEAAATYRADREGVIDTAADRSMRGSYRGVVRMGLIMAMRPPPATAREAVYVPRPTGPMRFLFTVRAGGRLLASRTVLRSTVRPGVRFSPETLARTGFEGLWMTPSHAVRGTAVLLFGGSEGGGQNGSLLQAQLASHGFPTLQVAYFDAPGLPPNLEAIPLEYFARALTWMTRQPQVNPRRIYVMSGSYGTEAALLLAVHYPSLVHGVVASSPGDVATTGLTAFSAEGGFKACHCAAWTYQGRPVPTSYQFNNATPTDVPDAVIPVEQIHGPVLTDCGGFDQVWGSCLFGHQIQSRLDGAHDPYPHPFYRYPDAGHGVDALVPYDPGLSLAAAVDAFNVGGRTPLANAIADAILWPKILSFLSGS